MTGQQSGATGVVKSAVVFQNANDNPEQNVTNHVYDVVLDNYTGDFVPGEEIIPDFVPASLSTYFVVQDEFIVTRVDITTFGENYVVSPTDPQVVFSQPELPGGVAATATAKVSQGRVYEIEVTNPGSGYINVPSVTIESTNGNDATALARVKKGRQSVVMGIATSDDSTAGTRFKFDAPIYLLGNQVYVRCLLLFSRVSCIHLSRW